MKINLLSVAAMLIVSINILCAQPCVPENYNSPGIYPDTSVNLPAAYATLPYSGVITVVVPVDTTLPPFGTVQIDSLKITGVTSTPALPASLSWMTNSSGNLWLGGEKGCLVITGTPAHGDTGIYHLTIKTKITGLFGTVTLPFNYTGFRVIVKDTALGISAINKGKFTLLQNSPNPFPFKTTIGFISPNADVYSFSVIDVLGNIVYNQSVKAVAGPNNFDFSAANMNPGLYLYKLSNKTYSYTRRMIVEEK